MTRKEFAICAMALKTYYPREKILENKQATELWYKKLNDIPYDIMEAAIDSWVSTNKWSPTIADLREKAAEIQNGYIPDWSEGWKNVLLAIRRYGSYEPEKAIESLDSISRECVKRIGYREICLSEKIAVERANFRDIYEILAKRKKQDAQIPAKTIEYEEREALEMMEGTSVESKLAREN